MRRSTPISLVATTLVVSACSAFLGETPVDSAPGSTDSSSTSGGPDTTEPPPTGCVRFTGDHNTDIDTGSLAGDALYLSGEVFVCADDVVVVEEGDLNEIAAAAQLAAALSAPLLFPDPRLRAELGRLNPRTVHVVGAAVVDPPNSAEMSSHDIAGALALAGEEIGAGSEVPLPAAPDASTVVETVLALTAGDRVAHPATTTGSTIASTTGSTTGGPPALDTAAIVRGLAVASDAVSIWMVDATRPATILLSAAVGRSLGASVVAIDGTNILGYPEVGEAIAGRPDESLRYIGGTPEAGDWELALLASGLQVPGGGYHILPADTPRRYLAYYGHPQTTALGVLGEQGPAETLTAMQGFIEAYAGDGSQVIPTFEMIASVASAGPTDDGDYSFEWPVDTFIPWVDFATANGMYVMLDLQSGRDDFLSQAVQYEELLLLPNVGLALDPEWRLAADQVHLQQVGRVEAAEINEVVNWLADLVRDNGLPQKMMIVHQFRTAMIQNRQDLVARPEIQMIVQMDGDGTEPQKDATWAALHEGAADVHWSWGWKNFFDEDEPGPPTPESTMGKVPSPVYVSYQ